MLFFPCHCPFSSWICSVNPRLKERLQVPGDGPESMAEEVDVTLLDAGACAENHGRMGKWWKRRPWFCYFCCFLAAVSPDFVGFWLIFVGFWLIFVAFWLLFPLILLVSGWFLLVSGWFLLLSGWCFPDLFTFFALWAWKTIGICHAFAMQDGSWSFVVPVVKICIAWLPGQPMVFMRATDLFKLQPEVPAILGWTWWVDLETVPDWKSRKQSNVFKCNITIYYHILPYITIYYHILPYITIYYHILPYITIYCHILPYITIYYHILPYITIYYHILPYITIYYHILPIKLRSIHLCLWCLNTFLPLPIGRAKRQGRDVMDGQVNCHGWIPRSIKTSSRWFSGWTDGVPK